MESNENLIQHLVNSGALKSKNIIDAFKQMDRVNFVKDDYCKDAYEDFPLSIGYGQTISQPTTVAMMLEMLKPSKGQTILDIGSGSGWSTALLSFIVGEEGFVTGLERIDSLVEFGNKNLKKYKINNAKIIHANDELGLVGEKFDSILVSAAADKLPLELLEQLKIGGKLVIPIQNSIYEITKKENDKFEKIEHFGFTFVPLIYT